MSVVADLLEKLLETLVVYDWAVPILNMYMPSVREPLIAAYAHISFVIKDLQLFMVSGLMMALNLLIRRT